MITRPLVYLLVFFALSTTACAYRSAIERGHRLARMSDYRGALSAYQSALSIDPDDEEAIRYLSQIKPYAIAQAERAALSEANQGRYERAVKHASYVKSLSSPNAKRLTYVLAATIQADIDGLLSKSSMATAYPLAIRARKLFPRLESLPASFAKLRKHYFDASERLAAAEHYAKSLQQLDVVAKHEPELGPQIDKRRRAIRNRWADKVVAAANKQLAADHVGAAATLFGRAYEIAGRTSDLESMREHVRALRRLGSFLLLLNSPSSDGPDESGLAQRSDNIRSQVAASAAKIAGVAFPDDRDEGVTMLAEVRALPTSCAERFAKSIATQQYVAGHREVANPEHQRLSRRLDQAEASVASLDAQYHAQETKAQRLRATAAKCHRQQTTPAETKLTLAESKQKAAAAAVDAQRQLIQDLERRLRRQRRKRKKRPAGRSRLRARLAEARAELARLEGAASAAKSALRRAQSAFDNAKSACRSDENKASRAERALEPLSTQLASEQAEAARLRNKLLRTPATVSEPVYANFDYEVRHYTRSCNAGATIRLQPSWTTEERHQKAVSRATKDSTHPAHARYGVAADPLVFTLSDEELIAAADGAASSAISTILRKRVLAYYRSMAERADKLAAEGSDAATDMMVAMLLAARKQLDAAATARFEAYLKEHYGLENTTTLSK